jgi:hypothetical protein
MRPEVAPHNKRNQHGKIFLTEEEKGRQMNEQFDPSAPYIVYLKAQRAFSQRGRNSPLRIFISLKQGAGTIILEPQYFHYEDSHRIHEYDSVGRTKYQELMPQFNKIVVKVLETDREYSFETYDEFIRKISEA